MTDRQSRNHATPQGEFRTGRQMLANRPRTDMPGFRLVDQREIVQEAKYQARLKRELEIRAAIARGEKIYEKP